MLTITLLGTAATMPLPDRALTAAAAECVGHSLLFDCGEGTQAAARRAGVNLMKLDAICLTHYHGDHIFGLPGLLQTLGCQGRTRPLVLYGPAGLDAIWPALRTLTGPLPYPIRARQLEKDPVDLAAFGWPAGAQLLPIPTRHRVPSRGYALTLPRAGRFLPEKARALGVPVADWKKLQHGETVQVREWDPGRGAGPAAPGAEIRLLRGYGSLPGAGGSGSGRRPATLRCHLCGAGAGSPGKTVRAQHIWAERGPRHPGRGKAALAGALFAHDHGAGGVPALCAGGVPAGGVRL